MFYYLMYLFHAIPLAPWTLSAFPLNELIVDEIATFIE